MKTSVIRQRVADFLRQYAPFDALDASDLLDLAGSGKVKFHQSEEYIYQQGESRSDLLWVIQQGRVELVDVNGEAESLRDVLGAGDLLGLDGFVGEGRFQHSARTTSDVILYGISSAQFQVLADKYQDLKRFIQARFSMEGWGLQGKRSWLDAEAPPESFLKSRLHRKTAVVAAGGYRTLPQPFTTRSLVKEMLHRGVDLLGVTGADGSLSGLIDSSELALFCGYDVPRLINELASAESIEELKPLVTIAQSLVHAALSGAKDIDDCRMLSGSLMKAAVTACIAMAERDALREGLQRPDATHAWIMFGAAARGDSSQILLPSLAVIYDSQAAELLHECSSYFVWIAGKTAQAMHNSGLIGETLHWPDGAHPAMPVSEWIRFYQESISNPVENAIYERREFFDLSPLSGNTGILSELESQIHSDLLHGNMAVAMLANDTMGNVPPLTFFEGLVVELDGAKKDNFDIEAVLISPIADAARVFALAKGRIQQASTLERLEMAASDYLHGASELRNAAEAFRIGLFFQAQACGNLVYPGTLPKADQMLLKTAIVSVERLLRFTVATFVEVD